MKKNRCYCINCRMINNPKSKRCTKCNSLLKPNDKSFVNLVKKEYIGAKEDELFEKGIYLARKIIKSHLYSSILIVSMAASIIPSVVVANNMKDTVIVSERPIVENGVIVEKAVIEEVEDTLEDNIDEEVTTKTTTTTTKMVTTSGRNVTTSSTTTTKANTTNKSTSTTTTTGITIPSANINLTTSRGGTLAVLDAVMRNDSSINNKVKYTANYSDSQRMVNGYLQCYQAYNSSGTVVDSLTNKMGSFDIKNYYARIYNLNLPSLSLDNDSAIKKALNVECYYGSVGESVPLVQESLDAGITDIAAYYVQLNPCKDTSCSNVNTPTKETSRNIFVIILGKRNGKWYYITTSSHVPKNITYTDPDFSYYVLGNFYTYEQAKNKFNF